MKAKRIALTYLIVQCIYSLQILGSKLALLREEAAFVICTITASLHQLAVVMLVLDPPRTASISSVGSLQDGLRLSGGIDHSRSPEMVG